MQRFVWPMLACQACAFSCRIQLGEDMNKIWPEGEGMPGCSLPHPHHALVRALPALPISTSLPHQTFRWPKISRTSPVDIVNEVSGLFGQFAQVTGGR